MYRTNTCKIVVALMLSSQIEREVKQSSKRQKGITNVI
jgi:hypothetical protein